MFKILIADEILPEGVALLRAAPDAAVTDVRLDRGGLLECISQYDALIVRSGTPVDRALLERGARLRIVARAGLGYDNIDVASATERGVMVMHVPQAYTVAAAEHTLGLLLALCRHLPAADASVRRGEWARDRFLGTQLHAKTLGLIGFGRVGRMVAARALAFGMDVLVYDPYADDEAARRLGAVVATFDEVLARSDFLTLHPALTPETNRVLGPAEIARLKPGVRLVNCARGQLVDEAALYAALCSGQIAGAALDVFAEEPPAASPLLDLPNVILTPHLGSSTREAQREVSVQVAQQVLDALRGQQYHEVVNLPFIPGSDFSRARPYLELAETIGRLQSRLAGERLGRVEIEIKGADVENLVKPVAVALLKGLLRDRVAAAVNYINAPMLAAEHGLTVGQARDLGLPDYAHLLSCRLAWDGGQRLIAGTLFGGVESRIVQIDSFRMDARPQGEVLVMRSRDVPGVIGIVGTLLAQYGVNIAEWRLGRDQPGGTALSFINLDSPMPVGALVALRALPQVIEAQALTL